MMTVKIQYLYKCIHRDRGEKTHPSIDYYRFIIDNHSPRDEQN